MPASETPTNPQHPAPPSSEHETGTELASGSELSSGTEAESPHDRYQNGDLQPEGYPPESPKPDKYRQRSGSRYLDYETHELLETISQLEDERRWQRIREGIWISIIAHALFFSLLSWIPRYIFHQPIVIDPSQAIRNRKDLTYLDELPDALKQVQKAKPALKPQNSAVDKKTLEALKALQKSRAAKPAPAAASQPSQPLPPPPETAQLPQEKQPAQLPPSTAPPAPSPQIALDTPRPSPLPAKPNFSLGPQDPADQLKQAMRDSAHAPGGGGGAAGGSLGQHPGADGGAKILSDTQGVDFDPYLQKVIRETYRTWDPLIPEEVNPPILKRGQVEVVFTILPNGRLQPHAMLLTGRSGDVALDRAAWGAIEGADYPPLPREFHGPYLQLRFRFQYNVK